MKETFSAKDHLHRTQFYCTDQVTLQFDHWNEHLFGGTLKLCFHNNLPFSYKENDAYQMAVLGYAVNPFYNEESPEDTLERCLQLNPLEGSFFEELDHLSGMFTFWVYQKKTNHLLLFPDNGTILEAYYKKDDGGIFIASQVKLLQKLTQVKKKEVFREYENPPFKLNPLYNTFFENVYKLIPNHYYDVNSGKQLRYFPYKDNIDISFEEGVDILSQHCKRTMDLFSKNYELAIPITAGWDSKLLLAYSRSSTSDVLFYTIMYPNYTLKNIDVTTASLLAKKANVNHTIATFPDRTYEPLNETLNESIDNANSNLLSSQFKHINNETLKHKLVLTGTAIETAKNYFVHLDKIDEHHLITLAKIGNSDFIKNTYRDWLQNSKDHIQKHGFKIADIFHWEQNIGAFVSRSSTQNNLSQIQALFPAYNCKYLISSLLGVKDVYRGKHHNKLFKTVIQNEWPELNEIPVNDTLKEKGIKLMCNLNVYDTYRRMKLKLRLK